MKLDPQQFKIVLKVLDDKIGPEIGRSRIRAIPWIKFFEVLDIVNKELEQLEITGGESSES